MRVRKMISLLLALLLLSACPSALAVPTRDARNAEVTDEGVQALAEVLFSAYIGPDWETALATERVRAGCILTAAEDAAGPMAWQALAYAMERAAPTTVIPVREAAALAAQVWTGGTWDAAGAAESGLLRVSGDTVELLAERLHGEWRLGAYLYDIDFGADGVRALADLYACPADYEGPVEELPAEAAVWLLGGAFTFRAAPGAAFGYTADECVFTPAYGDGMLAAWQDIDNAEQAYSVRLPSQFTQPSETLDPAPGTAWKNADGTAEIAVYAAASGKTFAQTLESFREAHPGWEIRAEEEFDRICGMGEGAFEMWVTSPAIPVAYCVVLRFPAERQAEYTLYAEWIRNSFIAWEISNG